MVPSPRFNPVEFIDKIIKIVKQESVDLVIPTCEEIMCLSKKLHYFPSSCRVFCTHFPILLELHNKWMFYKKLKSMGLPAPRTYLIEKNEDLVHIPFHETFAFKPCYSRASQRVRKIHMDSSITDIDVERHNPWIAQEWLEGEKYCTYSVCYKGNVQAHVTYPVHYAIDNSSCLNFSSVDHEGIFEWVRSFVEREKFTGQIAFDFIVRDQCIYAIECNPRATHGLLLFTPQDRLDRAFFEPNLPTIKAATTSRKQIAMGMIMFGWKKKSNNTNWRAYFKTLFGTPDVVFHRKDLKPFFFMPFLFFRYIAVSLMQRIRIPAAFTYDIDWNGEE
ncbi:MAG: ATP-grasp domain-containing protein [Chlamydiales bacterium]